MNGYLKRALRVTVAVLQKKLSTIYKLLTSSVGLVLSLFDSTVWVSIVRIPHFLIPVGYGYMVAFLFSIPFGSIYHSRTFIPRQNGPSMNMDYNGVDPNNNSGVQKILSP